MKIVVTSDLHGYLPKEVPKCDLLLICGDIVPLDIQSDEEECRFWMMNSFISWCESLPCDKVLFICGNHEVGLRNSIDWLNTNFPKDYYVTHLCDSLYEYNGVKIYGTPWCKIFLNWAFMLPNDELKEKFSLIPDNLDILMTHDAPYGTSDICSQDIVWNTHDHIGNIPLRDAVLSKSPKYNFHGHLHTSNHELEMLGNTKVYNVSYIDELYNPAFKMFEMYYE